jgi:hypothetical protein
VTGALMSDCTPIEIDPFADTDADTCVNYLDADSDNDSLADGDEQIGVCDPDFDADGFQNMVDLDSDADTLGDFAEVNPLADADSDGCQNFLDVDSDGDMICDGNAVFGATCAIGPDNCQLDANLGQTNTDGDDFGDACDDCVYEVNNNQPPFFTGTIGPECTCGDVARAGGGAPDGSVDGDDLTAIRDDVAGVAPLTGQAAEKCAVDGPPGPCNALHIAILTRALDPNTAGPLAQACRPAICLAVAGSNFDGDCLADPNDSCPTVSDFEPVLDADMDGVSDACDTCRLVQNPPVDPNTIQPWMTLVSGQRDDDGDGTGNRCDFKYTGNTLPLIGMEDTLDMGASLGEFRDDPNGPSCATTMDQLCAQYDHDEVNAMIDVNDEALLLLQVGMPNGTDCGTACTPAFSDPNAPTVNHVLCSGPQCALLP